MKTDDVIAEVNIFFAKIGNDTMTEFVFVGFLFEGFDVTIFSLSECSLSSPILSCSFTLSKDTTAWGCSGGGSIVIVVWIIGVVVSLSKILIVILRAGGIVVEGSEWCLWLLGTCILQIVLLC